MIARIVTVLTAAALTLASCSISEDAVPRAISEDPADGFGVVAGGAAAAGDRVIYLLAPLGAEEQRRLRAVRRETSSDPREVLQELVNGENVEENAAGLNSAIPADLEIQSARTVGTRLTVDINDALSELSEIGLLQALAQIVATATEIEQVQQVRLRVNGDNRAWPTGDGEVSELPLTIYDFPEFLETSQPGFPTTPSG